MSRTKDLGTYHLRIELEDGRGWIETWNTGKRFTNGTEHETQLDATMIHPTWESEDDLFSAMRWHYTEANGSCDCNKILALARAYQQPEPEEVLCGDSMPIKRLTAIRPDASEEVIFSTVPFSR
jgi:hypothetical protein